MVLCVCTSWTSYNNEKFAKVFLTIVFFFKILATSQGRKTIETMQLWIPELATPEAVNEIEGKLALEMEGVIVLPGVCDMKGWINLIHY
jgi:hypothetical protein